MFFMPSILGVVEYIPRYARVPLLFLHVSPQGIWTETQRDF